MRLPNDEECMRAIAELEDEPELTEWESQFVDSNLARTTFTDLQKLEIAKLLKKYQV